MTTKFWKPIGSSKLIWHPRWDFFAPVNSTGRGVQPGPTPVHRLPTIAVSVFFLSNARIDKTIQQLIGKTCTCRYASTSATWDEVIYVDRYIDISFTNVYKIANRDLPKYYHILYIPFDKYTEKHYYKEYPPMNPMQHGFRSGRSCPFQAARSLWRSSCIATKWWIRKDW